MPHRAPSATVRNAYEALSETLMKHSEARSEALLKRPWSTLWNAHETLRNTLWSTLWSTRETNECHPYFDAYGDHRWCFGYQINKVKKSQKSQILPLFWQSLLIFFLGTLCHLMGRIWLYWLFLTLLFLLLFLLRFLLSPPYINFFYDS